MEVMKGAVTAPGSNDSVRVCLRIRPCSENEANIKRCISAEGDSVFLDAKPSPKIFSYDRVADGDTGQEEMFATVGKPIADSCLAGFHGTIFAYGQTGSGKTFTIQGVQTPDGDDIPELRGLIPRVVEYVFSIIARDERNNANNIRYFCKCSYLEIYNEKITDLLNPSVANLRIREDIKKGVYVEGLTEEVVTSTEEACAVLKRGAKNRHIGATLKNKSSSRSHAIFSLVVESKETKGGISSLRFARLNLIDLAGSERQKHTQAMGVRLKEAGCINKSLSLLGNVIRALVDVANGKVRYVPYRDSKLTFLLKDSLGGNSKTYIIATVSPLEDAFGETLSTLKFAQRAKLILNKAVVNQDTLGSVAELQNEVKRLKEQLLYTSSLLKGQGSSGSPLEDRSIRATVYLDTEGRDEPRANLISECSSLENRIQGLQRLISRVLQFQEKEDKLRSDNEALQRKIEALEALSRSKEESLQSMAAMIRLKEEEVARTASSHSVSTLPVSQLKKPSTVLPGKEEALISKIPRPLKKEPFASSSLINVSTRLPHPLEEESSKDSMWRKASVLQTELLNREILQLKEQLKNHPEALRLATENVDLKKELGEYKHLFANEMENYNRQYGFLQESHRLLCRELEDLLKDKDTFINIVSREKAMSDAANERDDGEDNDNESEVVPGESVVEKKEWEEKEKVLLEQVAELQRQLLAKEEEAQTAKEKMQEFAVELNVSRTAHKQLEIKFEAELKASQTMQKEMEAALVEARESKNRELNQFQQLYERERDMWQKGFMLSESFSAEATERIKVLEVNLSNAQLALKTAETVAQEKDKVNRELKSHLAKYEHENRRMSQCFIKNGKKGRLSLTPTDNGVAEERAQVEATPSKTSRSGRKKSIGSMMLELDMKLSAQMLRYDRLKEKYSTLKEEHDVLQEESRYQINQLESQLKEAAPTLVAEKEMQLEKLREELVAERGKLTAKEEELEHEREIERTKEAQREMEKEKEQWEMELKQDQKKERKLERQRQRDAEKEEKERELLRQIEREQEKQRELNDMMVERQMHMQREREREEERQAERERIQTLETLMEQQREIESERQTERLKESEEREHVAKENLRWIEELEALQEAHKQLVGKLEGKELQLAHLQEFVSSLEKSNADLSANLNQANEIIVLLKESVESNKVQAQELGEEHTSAIEGMLEDANLQLLEQSHQIQQLRKEVEQKESSMKVLAGQVELLLCEKARYEEMLAQAQSSQTNDISDDYEEKLKLRDAQIQELKRTVADMEEENRLRVEDALKKSRDAEGIKKAEIEKLSSQLSISFSEREKLLEELKRVKTSELIAFQESMHFKDKTRCLEEERLALLRDKNETDKQLQELVRQNAELVGHQNPKQKIQLHVRIKEENNELKKKLNHSQQVVRRLQQEILKLHKKLGLEEKLPIINVDEETELKMKLMQKDKETKSLAASLELVHEQIVQLLLQCELEDKKEKENGSEEMWVDGTDSQFEEGVDMNFAATTKKRRNRKEVEKEALNEKTRKMLQKVVEAFKRKEREIKELQFHQQMAEREISLRKQQLGTSSSSTSSPQSLPILTPTPSTPTPSFTPTFSFSESEDSDAANIENIGITQTPAAGKGTSTQTTTTTPLANVTNTLTL